MDGGKIADQLGTDICESHNEGYCKYEHPDFSGTLVKFGMHGLELARPWIHLGLVSLQEGYYNRINIEKQTFRPYFSSHCAGASVFASHP